MNFRPGYGTSYLGDLADQGINTVLIEYEDAFPFHGIDITHDPAVRWSPGILRQFTGKAKRRRIEVIPLQQCLGHLEYALSWDRYRHLAEDPDHPTMIRIDEPAAQALVGQMLEQVIAAHPDSKYVHLGLDEVHELDRAAARLGCDPLELFLQQLRHLLRAVERAGKMPIIWADMLERHFRAGALDEFRDRVILMPWFDFPIGEHTPYAPLGGRRTVTRAWLNQPADPDAPPIGPENNFLEDLAPELRQAVAPYQRSRLFKPLAQVELWSQLGMRVIGGSAVRSSVNGSVLPLYHRQFSNVTGWSRMIRACAQLGQIGTSWARGTSWAPPNLCIDLQWPIVTELARSMGAKPRTFWPGIPAATLARLFHALGRCGEDWRIELAIAGEMEQLSPRIRAHQFEWHSVILMARTLDVQRRADAELSAMEGTHADHRPVDSEWQRHIDAQTGILADLSRMRRDVRRHFGRRYHGLAFEEWIRHLFDFRVEQLRESRRRCRVKSRLARRRYARNAWPLNPAESAANANGGTDSPGTNGRAISRPQPPDAPRPPSASAAAPRRP